MTASDAQPQDRRHSDLEQAWAAMRFEVLEGRFCLLGSPDEPTAEDLELLSDPPAQLIREGGETTVLAAERHLEGLRERHPRGRFETDLVWVRFEAPMAWDLVGFLARVSGALAAAGVPIGAVCGFSRDHLFVAASHLAEVERVLGGLFDRVR